jgi:hypothetical protein
VTVVDEDSDGLSSVTVTRKSSRKRVKKKRMKKSMSKINDILSSISIGMNDVNKSTKKGRASAISGLEVLFTSLSSEIELLTNEVEGASSGSSDDAEMNNHSKSELSSLLVSVLRQVANEKVPGTAYPSPASLLTGPGITQIVPIGSNSGGPGSRRTSDTTTIAVICIKTLTASILSPDGVCVGSQAAQPGRASPCAASLKPRKRRSREPS